MHLKFKKNLTDNFPKIVSEATLLAVSGGIDSVVLFDLFLKSKLNFAVVHCNFNLRDSASDGDQLFVEQLCKENQIPFYTTNFNTIAFAKDFKLSTQLAARKLRYDYFYELIESEKLDWIATGHHLDDSLETFIINLSRGTGIDGLTGIPLKNEKIIRPLLNFSRKEIENYALKNNLKWREDASNASDYYLRNKIRHHLTPILHEANPAFSNSFLETLKNLQQSKSMIEDASKIVYQQVVLDELDYKKINILELKKLSNFRAYLFHWLQPLGFSAWTDIYDLVDAETGKQVFSENFRVLKDRDYLIITPKSIVDKSEYSILKGTSEVNVPIKLLLCKVTNLHNTTNKTIFVDNEKLSYPLTLRRWKSGDVFYPFGMEGRSKKVSKLFKDEKLSSIEKVNSWLLCSNDQIVWVVGIRADERFKINKTTNNILQIDLIS